MMILAVAALDHDPSIWEITENDFRLAHNFGFWQVPMILVRQIA